MEFTRTAYLNRVYALKNHNNLEDLKKYIKGVKDAQSWNIFCNLLIIESYILYCGSFTMRKDSAEAMDH